MSEFPSLQEIADDANRSYNLLVRLMQLNDIATLCDEYEVAQSGYVELTQSKELRLLLEEIQDYLKL